MKINVNCKNCNKEFESDTRETNRGKGICCSRKCGSEYANKNRPLINLVCQGCLKPYTSKMKNSKFCTIQCNQKSRTRINGTNETGRNTLSKRINKLKKSFTSECFSCKWNKCACDIHHIVEKSNGGSDDLNNLTILCPNCHRLVHKGLLKCTESVIERLKSQELDSNPHSPT
jgi:hypothetical protein